MVYLRYKNDQENIKDFFEADCLLFIFLKFILQLISQTVNQ